MLGIETNRIRNELTHQPNALDFYGPALNRVEEEGSRMVPSYRKNEMRLTLLKCPCSEFFHWIKSMRFAVLPCQEGCIDITGISPMGTYSETLMQGKQKEGWEIGET